MAPTDHHVPDVDLPKHSLLSMGIYSSDRKEQIPRGTLGDCAAETGGCITSQHEVTRLRKRKKSKSDSLVTAMCQWVVEHQVGLSVNLLLLHALAHICFPKARQSTRKFYQLSYFNSETKKYALGWDDFYMVVYSIVALTGLRAFTLDYILVPLAQFAGVSKRKEKLRFAEQAWVLIYDSIFWSLGMYIMYTHEHWLNLRELWTHWPNRELEGSMKWYYLVQFSFWLQQIVIVHIEERRKDHWQMFTHHVITCFLMFTSYGYHQTKVGNMILCLMDVVDVFLAFAKILKYLKFQMACDIAFGVFILVWFVTRHVLYAMVVYSVYDDIPKEINYGCYSGSAHNISGPIEVPNDYAHLIDPFRDPNGLVCWDNSTTLAYVFTLSALQVILLLWFGMIIRVAAKVLRGGEAEDSRSDDEDEEEEEETHEMSSDKKQSYDKPIEVTPLEEEVSFDELNICTHRSSPARRYRKGGGMASGVNLHSDRKELLGRIGCDGGHE